MNPRCPNWCGLDFSRLYWCQFFTPKSWSILHQTNLYKVSLNTGELSGGKKGDGRRGTWSTILLNFSTIQAVIEQAGWEAETPKMSQKFPRRISVFHHKKRRHFFNCSSHAIINVLQYETLFSLQQRREGAIVIHSLICLYCFGALAILCDHYFCASLEKLCKRWVINTLVNRTLKWAVSCTGIFLFLVKTVQR